ncbi:MAG: hypothetical protein K0S95_3372 [Pantoea eucrina]|jgi:hypothetical protein|uniref:DnaJ family domain-containing protein n=1 Tax=Pantoea eucrina TaxID=472693 RepID=UPI00080F57B7|nr:DUF1992 domain-containing protein [Pantoea eucrina]MDF2786837.1 hypothetical protein [Pantoea eucrina]
MWLIDQLAEQHIREAQAKGEFSNLPGEGAPLQLDDDSGVPSELRTAYRLLKNAGYLPPELEARKEALELHKLLQTLEAEEPAHADISRRLALLESKLQQAGLSTDFLYSHYRADIAYRFKREDQ